MITSLVDPRDERFLLFLDEAAEIRAPEMAIPRRIERLSAAMRAYAEVVEVQAPPSAASRWAIHLAGWALSPDPVSLRPWAINALHALRRDPIRARNVAGGVVDWVLGQVRTRTADLRVSWQAMHDASLAYPLDDTRIMEPAQASAEVAVWSYALLRAIVVRHHRGAKALPSTFDWASSAGRRGK